MRISDWSSDVCSSDLHPEHGELAALDSGKELRARPLDPIAADAARNRGPFGIEIVGDERLRQRPHEHLGAIDDRSEERCVGKECGSTYRSRWSSDHEKKKAACE